MLPNSFIHQAHRQCTFKSFNTLTITLSITSQPQTTRMCGNRLVDVGDEAV